MIKEISNFVEKIDDKYFTEGLTPSDGLHIWIKLDDKGKEIGKKVYRVKTISKNKKTLDENHKECVLPEDLILREYFSGLISTNKSLDLPAKKIHSSSPFVIWFKKQNENNISDLLKIYFKNTKKYFDKSYHDLIDMLHNYLSENINLMLMWANEIFDDIKTDEYIKIYLDEDLGLVKKGFMEYLGSSLFNKADYNLENDEYGLSGFLNGDNVKKIFIMHKTTHFNINNHISRREAYNLYVFTKLLNNKPLPKLPNPLPIFIDEEEMFNKRVIELYGKNKVLSFHQIIHKLIDNYKRDLSNYYLIFWSRKGGLTINDFDFVPFFRFKLDNFILSNYFFKEVNEQKIVNVFDFEVKIIQKIFNNVLVQRNKDESHSYKYFDEIEYKPQYMTQNTHINVLKYRKAIYDFVYKSKQNAITNDLFDNLMISTIIDDIKHDAYKNNNHTKEFNIKEKLNIYFSLNKNFGGEEMGSKIQPLQEKLELLFKESDVHIETDEEFAFDAGQLVYYILYQSEASNKTHALMEPYISKSDSELFKTTIARGIDQYKHKLPFGTKKFQKLASEVLGWQTEIKIKDMLPLFLAGYFSNSLLFESNK